jgi:hypothetical protein
MMKAITFSSDAGAIMKYFEFNPSKKFLLRTIVSGLFLGIPTISFSSLPALSLPGPCSELLCQTSSSKAGLESVQSPTLLSQIRPIEPQQPNDDERIILDEGADGRLALDDGTVDIKLMNETDNTVVLQLTTGDDPQTTMGMIDGTDITLHNLDTPVDINMVRPVGGFVQVVPEIVAANQLEVRLIEPTSSSNVSLVEGTLSVLEDGSVYLNEIYADELFLN